MFENKSLDPRAVISQYRDVASREGRPHRGQLIRKVGSPLPPFPSRHNSRRWNPQSANTMIYSGG